MQVLWLGPYDFRDAENTDVIAESSHKNGIYSLTWNVTEFCQSLDELIKSRSLHLNQIAIWNPGFMESVSVWMEQTRGFVYFTYTARDDFIVCRLNEDINTWTMSPKLESHFTSILPFDLSKTRIISYTHRTLKVFTATRQNKSSV